jgi:hypothetical protein
VFQVQQGEVERPLLLSLLGHLRGQRLDSVSQGLQGL